MVKHTQTIQNCLSVFDHFAGLALEGLRINMCIGNSRGHCYDGTEAIKGARSRITTRLKFLNGKIFYVHSYGHFSF